MNNEKAVAPKFWNQNSCGEKHDLPSSDQAGHPGQLEERFRIELSIPTFAELKTSHELEVLKISGGLGSS